MKLILYSKAGTQKAVVSSVTYSGEWMGSRSVSVSVESESLIDFQVGDYVMYRGGKYVIREDNAILKNATAQSTGKAFQYDNVKLDSFVGELDMITVLNCTYTEAGGLKGDMLHKFDLFCENVGKLADVIKANLKRAYNEGVIDEEWDVTVNNNVAGGKKDITLNFDGVSVAEACKMAYEQFAVGYTIELTSRIIKFGSQGQDLPTLKYGKGNGLTKLKKSVKSDNLITSLRCMGNSTNMPQHYYYYREIVLGSPNMSRSRSLMFSRTDTTPCLYREISDDVVAVLGKILINGEVTTITDTLAGEQKAFKWSFSSKIRWKHKDTAVERIDACMVSAYWSWKEEEEGGVTVKKGNSMYVVINGNNTLMEEINTNAVSGNIDVFFMKGYRKECLYLLPTRTYLPNHNFERFDRAGVNLNTLRNVVNLQLPLFSSNNVNCYIEDADAIAKYGKREGVKVFDTDSEDYVEDIYPQLHEQKFLCDAWKKDVTGEAVVLDNGMLNETKTDVDNTFYIKTANLGFGDTKDEIKANISNGGNATLIIKSGSCAGREFEITAWEVNEDLTYTLACTRDMDSSTSIMYPNSIDMLDENVQFAITNIYMPDSYIESAAERLKTAAENYLAAHSKMKYTYELTIDSKWILDNHKLYGNNSFYYTIKEGDRFFVEDAELATESVGILVDKLSITEKDGKIQIQVTLRDEKKDSQLVYIEKKATAALVTAEQASVSVRKARGVAANGGAADTAENANIANYAIEAGHAACAAELDEDKQEELDNKYLRKDGNDATTHKLKVSTLEVDEFSVNNKMSVNTLDVAHTEHVGGNMVLSGAKATITRVEESDSEWKCFFKANDAEGNKTDNMWRAGDFAYCKTLNLGRHNGVNGNKYYWRRVTSKGTVGAMLDEEHFISLSKTQCASGSNDAPSVGDYVVLRGSAVSGRQGVIELNSVGDGSPCIVIWEGVGANGFAMPEKPIFKGSPEEFYVKADKLKLETADNSKKTIKEYIDGLQSKMLVISGDDESVPSTDEDFLEECASNSGVADVSDLDGVFYVTTEQRVFKFDYSAMEWSEVTDGGLSTILLDFQEQAKVIGRISNDYCVDESEKAQMLRYRTELRSEIESLQHIHGKHADVDSIEAAWDDFYDAALSLDAIYSAIINKIPCYFSNNVPDGGVDVGYTRVQFMNAITNYQRKVVLFNEAVQSAVIDSLSEEVKTAAYDDAVGYVSEHISEILDDSTKTLVDGWIASYCTTQDFVAKSYFSATKSSVEAMTQWVGTDGESFGGSGLKTELDSLYVGVNAVNGYVGTDGKYYITNIDKSGLVSEGGFAAMFAREYYGTEELVAAAEMGTFVKHVGVDVLPDEISESFEEGVNKVFCNDDGRWYFRALTSADKAQGTYYYVESNATISADYVTIGSGKLGTHVSIEGDTMTLNKVVANDGVFKGRLEAEEGFFKGRLEGASGSFSGLIAKAPTTITAANLSQYVRKGAYSAYNILDFSKCGTYVKFKDLTDVVQIHFDNIKAETTADVTEAVIAYGAEYRDSVLKYLGSKIVIYNASSKVIWLDGVSPVLTNAAYNFAQILPNQVAYIECVFGYDALGGQSTEVVKWNAWVVNMRPNNVIC